MKKTISVLLSLVAGLSLVACSGTNTNETTQGTTSGEANNEPTSRIVTVTNAEGNPVDVEFPTNIERAVVLNWQTVDFLDAVGMGDIIVGCLENSAATPEHLKKYAANGDTIKSVGGMKDPDMEAIMELEPDVIFSSDRTESMYDELSKIAPTMAAYVNYKDGFMNGYKDLALTHATIFGVEDAVNDIISEYEDRISAIAEFSKDKTALLGIFAGGINTLGNSGRASIIVNEMGFTNLAGNDDVNHGNISSYEAWLSLNPDWMFILDKDTAVGTEAVSAKEQMEVNNPVIAETDAYKNGQIVYLEPASVWYVADGGITSMDLMISCIEKGIGLE